MASEGHLTRQQTICGSRQNKNTRVEKREGQFIFYEWDGGFEMSTKQMSTRVGLLECFLFVIKIIACA
jgi:hypothetical protein